MLRGKHVKIIIAADGTCTVDAVNFTGPPCQTATGEIAAALGGQIDHQHLRPEVRLHDPSGHYKRERVR